MREAAAAILRRKRTKTEEFSYCFCPVVLDLSSSVGLPLSAPSFRTTDCGERLRTWATEIKNLTVHQFRP